MFSLKFIAAGSRLNENLCARGLLGNALEINMCLHGEDGEGSRTVLMEGDEL